MEGIFRARDASLTLNVDVTSFVCQDTGEVGWWRGEIGGERGVFPDNFVVVISEAEREVR